jgi:hypothetical protein
VPGSKTQGRFGRQICVSEVDPEVDASAVVELAGIVYISPRKARKSAVFPEAVGPVTTDSSPGGKNTFISFNSNSLSPFAVAHELLISLTEALLLSRPEVSIT